MRAADDDRDTQCFLEHRNGFLHTGVTGGHGGAGDQIRFEIDNVLHFLFQRAAGPQTEVEDTGFVPILLGHGCQVCQSQGRIGIDHCIPFRADKGNFH